MLEVHSAAGEPVAEMVSRRALELLDLHGDEREERYELLKDQDFFSALDEGMSCADAWDMSERVGQCTLDLINRIAATGGAWGRA
ncbi:MAG: hypothetical protein ACXU82_07130 [Caulobacteraceae bacterium]